MISFLTWRPADQKCEQAMNILGVSPKEFRTNWARLIHKIYNVDPLLCPMCKGVMKIISFIEDNNVIEKILRHLGLWKTRNHDPPVRNVSHLPEFTYDDDYSQMRSEPEAL